VLRRTDIKNNAVDMQLMRSDLQSFTQHYFTDTWTGEILLKCQLTESNHIYSSKNKMKVPKDTYAFNLYCRNANLYILIIAMVG